MVFHEDDACQQAADHDGNKESRGKSDQGAFPGLGIHFRGLDVADDRTADNAQNRQDTDDPG